MKDLLSLHQSFAAWADSRRRKVDLVLSALNPEAKYTDLEEVQAKLNDVAKGNELLPAAQKMLQLHYLELLMTIKERFDMKRRTLRARKKLKKWKKNH